MRTFTAILLLITASVCSAQQPLQRNSTLQQVDTATLNLQQFALQITGKENDNYEKAKKILYWLSSNFQWTSTDYKKRTVKEIIARNGGNCFELATVYAALIKEAGIPYRNVAEINIHEPSEERQASAAELVTEKGNRYSVFGFQHNDHRWVEIYDSKNRRWEPADPSMGVIGISSWLKARVWFAERKTIDTAISNRMIVPFAIFVTGENNQPVENRTAYYLCEQFDALYNGQLSRLPEWNTWKQQLSLLTIPAMNAFTGKENLHLYSQQISNLATAYRQLKEAYGNSINKTGR